MVSRERLQQAVSTAPPRGCHHRSSDELQPALSDVHTRAPRSHLFFSHRMLGAVRARGDPHRPAARMFGWFTGELHGPSFITVCSDWIPLMSRTHGHAGVHGTGVCQVCGSR